MEYIEEDIKLFKGTGMTRAIGFENSMLFSETIACLCYNKEIIENSNNGRCYVFGVPLSNQEINERIKEYFRSLIGLKP